MDMFNPPHPGETLREDVLPALGLSVTEAARQLGVSRVALSPVLTAKAAGAIAWARRPAVRPAGGMESAVRRPPPRLWDWVGCPSTRRPPPRPPRQWSGWSPLHDRKRAGS